MRSMYMCTDTCEYVHVHAWEYIHACMVIHVRGTGEYIYMPLGIHIMTLGIRTCTYMYIHMNMHVHACTYMYMHVRTCM